MSSSSSLTGLSQLQRLVLVMLLDEGSSALKRSAFRARVKRFYWGEGHSAPERKHNVANSLSRALARLEARGYLERTPRGGWALTCRADDFVRNGWLYAINAWGAQKEVYQALGLIPSRKSLGLEPLPEQRKGVEVKLSC